MVLQLETVKTESTEKNIKPLPDYVVEPLIDEKDRESKVLFHDESNDFKILLKVSKHTSELTFSYGTEANICFDIVGKKANNFLSMHRFVVPEKRGKGIGTKLLKQAEVFFQKLANQQHEPVTIMMPIAQVRVMNWLKQADYEPDNYDRKKINQIEADYLLYKDGKPTKEFDFRDITKEIDDEDITRESYVFKKSYLEAGNKPEIDAAVRISFYKDIYPEK